MCNGFVDLHTRRDIPHTVARLLAVNEYVNDLSIGCQPLEVQLVPPGCLRVILFVDLEDADWIFKTGWVRKFEHHNEELFGVSWPTCTDTGAVARAVHTAEVLGSLMERLGFLSRIPVRVRVDAIADVWVWRDLCHGWLRPLTEDQREGLCNYAEELKSTLGIKFTINPADQARLFKVAFLGPAQNFNAPETLWLTGLSPSELRLQILGCPLVNF